MPGLTVLPKSVLPHQPKLWLPGFTSRSRACLTALAVRGFLCEMRRITLWRVLWMEYGSFVQRGAPFADTEMVCGCAVCVVTANAVAGKASRTAVAMMNRCMWTSG